MVAQQSQMVLAPEEDGDVAITNSPAEDKLCLRRKIWCRGNQQFVLAGRPEGWKAGRPKEDGGAAITNVLAEKET